MDVHLIDRSHSIVSTYGVSTTAFWEEMETGTSKLTIEVLKLCRQHDVNIDSALLYTDNILPDWFLQTPVDLAKPSRP